MTDFNSRSCRLVRWFRAYRQGGHPADFVQRVRADYSDAALQRLVERAGTPIRRAAVVALGMTADDRMSDVLGKALSDHDRCVRLLADRWIGEMWLRVVPPGRRMRLAALKRKLEIRPKQVLAELEGWERMATRHAEIWYCRALALQRMEHAEESLECFRIAFQLNPYHYPSACAQGHLLRAADRPTAALRYYHQALLVFPDLPRIRAIAEQLRRARQ